MHKPCCYERFVQTLSHANAIWRLQVAVMDGAMKFVQTCATIPQGTRQALGRAWQLDPDKPWFHVMPRNGWLNDPNGPIFYKGRYHMCACCICW